MDDEIPASSPPAEASVRVFFALIPSENALEFLHHRVRAFRAAGWERLGRFVPLHQLHLTLRFLGEIPESTTGLLAGRAAELAAECAPVTYEIGPACLFPRVSRARIVAAPVQPSAELKALVKSLESLATDAGLEPETRVFKPHYTLARLKNAMRRPNLPNRPGTFLETATALHFIESTLGPEGAIYTSRGEFALGPSDDSW